jgi:hypothetical protein
LLRHSGNSVPQVGIQLLSRMQFTQRLEDNGSLEENSKLQDSGCSDLLGLNRVKQEHLTLFLLRIGEIKGLGESYFYSPNLSAYRV